MKVLDRYILCTFLFSFLVVFVALVGMAVTLDLVVNLDEFTEEGASQTEHGLWHLLSSVCEYYFYKMFEYFQQLSGSVLLVAAAITLARFNKSNELTGIKASGISVYRVMWPILLCALGFNAMFLANQEYIIPQFAIQLTRDLDDLDATEAFPVRYIRDKHNNILYTPKYVPGKKKMLPGKVVKHKTTGQPIPSARPMIILRDARNHLVGTILADSATWDTQGNRWMLAGGLLYKSMESAVPRGAPPSEPPPKPVAFYETDIGPEQVERLRASDFYNYLSYREVRELARDKERGNWRELAVAMHKHFAKPILNLVIVLLGLPFVVGKEGKSYIVSVLICCGLVLSVFAVEYAATEFGNSGHIAPALAAWMPVFGFFPLSVLAMDSIRT
ncbi:MAG: LptF/LptG family permease [Phycisphaerae bacterium]|nr:LptF/LptG family permease [Phycisphaerae bacterium]